MAEELLVVNRRIRIPLSEFIFTFVRSSGPGGQNVNKVATKAQLRWNLAESVHVPDDIKSRFLQKFQRRITTDGVFVMTSQRYRDQKRNTDDCLEKLKTMLSEAAILPKPRKMTKPSRASVKRRLEGKKQRSERKQSRRQPSDDS